MTDNRWAWLKKRHAAVDRGERPAPATGGGSITADEARKVIDTMRVEQEKRSA